MTPLRQVLSFAAVGCHGRRWWMPAFAGAGFGAAGCVASSAALVLSAAAYVHSQTVTPDLTSDFAARIAATIEPGSRIHLVCRGDDGATERDLGRLLAGRGFRLTEPTDGAITVRCSCLQNLKERACIADIGEGAGRRVVSASRARDSEAGARDPAVGLELRPLYSQRDPILDLAVDGSSLLVLSPTAVKRVSTTADSGDAVSIAPITTARVWPRDLRGRIRTASGGAVEVFLPGVTCRGRSTPLTLACADEGESWPIDIDNAGIAPSRNTFATPEGLSFYEAASLGAEGWLITDRQGTLAYLDANRRVVKAGESADHVAALRASCVPGVWVASARSSDVEGGDALRLFRVASGALISGRSTIVLPGVITAIWPIQISSTASTERTAVVIAHDVHVGRYEAFHLSLSCAR